MFNFQSVPLVEEDDLFNSLSNSQHVKGSKAYIRGLEESSHLMSACYNHETWQFLHAHSDNDMETETTMTSLGPVKYSWVRKLQSYVKTFRQIEEVRKVIAAKDNALSVDPDKQESPFCDFPGYSMTLQASVAPISQLIHFWTSENPES